MANRIVWMSLALGLAGFTIAGDPQSQPPRGATSKGLLKDRPADASFIEVAKQALTDPELKDYELWASLLELPPAFLDTIKHRHDCELFGYVLEGEIEVQLEEAPPVRFREGQMFYEPRNILHSLLRNQSSSKPAKILVLQVIKTGRSGYIAEPTQQ